MHQHDPDVICLRGPSMVAHAYLEGTYSEIYPNIGWRWASRDGAGARSTRRTSTEGDNV
ncbi:MAG TPA: hypothetical protein VH643_26535 [Gemmataceae bacterium]